MKWLLKGITTICTITFSIMTMSLTALGFTELCITALSIAPLSLKTIFITILSTMKRKSCQYEMAPKGHHNNQHNGIQCNNNEHNSTRLHRTLYNSAQHSELSIKTIFITILSIMKRKSCQYEMPPKGHHNNQHNGIQYNGNEHNSTWLLELCIMAYSIATLSIKTIFITILSIMKRKSCQYEMAPKGHHDNQCNGIQYNDNEPNSTCLHRTLYNDVQHNDTQYNNNLYINAQHNEKKELHI
jgi:predicted type IV restriction endonuclease